MSKPSNKEHLEVILRENVWGYSCKDCGGGGALGQDKCVKCNGTGIVDWEYDLAIKEIQSLIRAARVEELNKLPVRRNRMISSKDVSKRIEELNG